MNKLFYIVDHYVPFPSSEYGGIWNVIAEDDDECFDLITGTDDGDFNSKYYGNLRENILKSRTYALSEDLESKIVDVVVAAMVGVAGLVPVYHAVKNGKKVIVSKSQFKNKGRPSVQKAAVKKSLELLLKTI